MKAAVLHTLGDMPRFEDFPNPTANEGEVLVRMRAAGLHPIVKSLASGKHYGASNDVPFIVGVDGVGVLEDGTRIYCGFARKPYGTMAEWTVVPKWMCIPLPEGIDDEQAAAIANPGMSAWLALKWRAKLTAGQTVLVLGATGAAGQLAVQLAKQLDAARVIAAGRNADVLNRLTGMGADAVIHLDAADDEVVAALKQEQANGIDAVLDYLWGRPAELVLKALSQKGLGRTSHHTRWVQVGESAGATITLPAEVLRSADIEMLGSGAGSVSLAEVVKAISDFFAFVVESGLRMDLERVPLAAVEEIWGRESSRLVFGC